ncbi:superfamily II DNA/RNA helicase [Clostridium pascui]|uniref:DEAD/DEAH box helicase n=1 Tax=Clostridium pascui TaxID=46609 RepID=UPI00195BDEDF|nr:DEAD/DEAH box helicase [Clostridium pascui]MBM7870446.1 superfamily II DNA/RNA helicase [Clostridium pascui]
MIDSFDKLGLNSNLIEGLKKADIINPTPIQSKVIPIALEKKDLVGQSQTGSGKTLAYLLPLFQNIDSSKREMQALILAPTHELVMQIDSEIKLLSQNSEAGITSTPIIGEVNAKRQIEKLKEKPHIIVGSVGRVLELISQKKIKAHTIKTIVLDEADNLLAKDKLSTVRNIIKTTLRDRQLMAFSATIHEETFALAKELMKEPEVLRVEDTDTVNENIEHIYFLSDPREKIETLRKLIASINPKRAIVFLNRNEEVDLATIKLKYHHINAEGIYSNTSKEDRKKALEGFRSGKVQLLISSDIAARGLDVKNVTHIFNLNLPSDPKEYLHRSGRTGRAGDFGTSISIISPVELSLIKKYEKNLNIKIQPKKILRGRILDVNLHTN